MFVFITARVSKYFDQGRHISQKEKKIPKKNKTKKKSSPSWDVVFQWTLEDLRVHYNEAPNAC